MNEDNIPQLAANPYFSQIIEEQDQFYDALAAYELMCINESSPALREKIEELHLRILNDPNGSYDPRLEQLFSPEELAYLKILHHQGFANLAKAREKLIDGMQGSELISAKLCRMKF
jgi:hypothetical protein